jgi:hypothetical protein
MKLTATIIRSVEADMQAELRHIERAVAAGTREAGRGLTRSPSGFFKEFTLCQVLLNTAKRRIRALCRWHSQPGGGPEYCWVCRNDGLPCGRGDPGADALIKRTRPGTCCSLARAQLRLAMEGQVVGSRCRLRSGSPQSSTIT